MNNFVMNENEIYTLIYNFSDLLPKGELIRTYNVYYNDVLVDSGLSGIVSFSQYNKDTILVTLTSDTSSGYKVSVGAETNRYNTYTKDFYVTIDSQEPVFAYNDFVYRIQTSDDDHSIYILPKDGSGFLNNNEYIVSITSGLSGIYNSPMTGSFEFIFSTDLCPIFTTPSRVKLRGGPMLDSYTDDTIWKMIHKNLKDSILNGILLKGSIDLWIFQRILKNT